MINVYNIKNTVQNNNSIVPEEYKEEQFHEHDYISPGSKKKKIPSQIGLEELNRVFNDTDKDLITKALKSHFLLKDLSNSIISRLIDNVVCVRVSANHTLFKKGDPGNYFYIVKSGTLEIFTTSEKSCTVLQTGSTFGELALVQKNKRTATVTCSEDAVLYCLDGNLFREVISENNKGFLKDRIYFLQLITLFSTFV